jgi:hypothetical protein
MFDWVIKILVISFVIWVMWSILQPRYVFEIRVNGGQPRVRRGKVTARFLGRLTAVCEEYGVGRGWIGGVQHGRLVALRFSHHFSPGLQQRLRNEWLTLG